MILINLTYHPYGNMPYDYSTDIPDNEFEFLLKAMRENRRIRVLPHEKSLLRTYFIKPHLDENDYIKTESIGKTFTTTINNYLFEYKLEKHE